MEKPPRTVRSEPMPVSCHTSSWKSASSGEGGVKGVGFGVADTGDDIPVVSRQAGERQRCPRRDDVQAAPRVERIGQTEQVVLIGATAVVEDEQAFGLAGGRALAMSQHGSILRVQGFG